jgi:hypothetical protein
MIPGHEGCMFHFIEILFPYTEERAHSDHHHNHSRYQPTLYALVPSRILNLNQHLIRAPRTLLLVLQRLDRVLEPALPHNIVWVRDDALLRDQPDDHGCEFRNVGV